MNRQVARDTLIAIDNSATTIIRVTQADEIRARQIIARYDDKNFSLTDAISFAIMDRLGISQAMSFDGNFEQYGVTMLTPGFFPLRPCAAHGSWIMGRAAPSTSKRGGAVSSSGHCPVRWKM